MGFATLVESWMFLCCPYWGYWSGTFVGVLDDRRCSRGCCDSITAVPAHEPESSASVGPDNGCTVVAHCCHHCSCGSWKRSRRTPSQSKPRRRYSHHILRD